MTTLRKTCTIFDADDVGTEKVVKKDVCLINMHMKKLSCTKKNTTINTTLLPLLPSSPPCTTLTEGGDLHRPCRTTSVPTTTLTPTRRGSALRRRRGVTLFLPCFYGNVLVPLVLLLLSMLIVVVESYSQLPNGNGQHADRTGNTINRIVDDWLDTNKRPGIEATYGPIGDWEVSLVKNFDYLFHSKYTFNADISKWNVAAAKKMGVSECSPSKKNLLWFCDAILSFLWFNVFFLCKTLQLSDGSFFLQFFFVFVLLEHFFFNNNYYFELDSFKYIIHIKLW